MYRLIGEKKNGLELFLYDKRYSQFSSPSGKFYKFKIAKMNQELLVFSRDKQHIYCRI